jgi:hypothetical protein
VIIIECQKIYLHINVLFQNNHNQRLSSMEKFDIHHNQWSMVKSMHRSRSNAGTATLRVKIYVGEGFVEVASTNTVQVFCPGTGSWSMMINPMRVGWSWVKVVAMNSMLCVVGMGSRG